MISLGGLPTRDIDVFGRSNISRGFIKWLLSGWRFWKDTSPLIPNCVRVFDAHIVEYSLGSRIK